MKGPASQGAGRTRPTGGAAQAAVPGQSAHATRATVSGPPPTSAPTRAGGGVAQGAAPASAPQSASSEKTEKAGAAKPRERRGTRAALRSFAAASLVTCSLVGFGGLAVSQPEVLGAADVGYAASLDRAVAQAEALPRLGQEAGTSASARQAFETAATDLATQIPRVAADAPHAQVDRLTGVAGGLSTYTSAVSRAPGASPSGIAADTQTFQQQVQAPLRQMRSDASNVSTWVPVAVFGLLSLIAVATVVGGAVSLAQRTRRVFNVPVTLGALVLVGVVAGGALTAGGVLTWPAGLAGATLLTGGVVAGVAAATGFLQRLQEYR